MTTHITQLASVYQAAPSAGSLQWCKVPSDGMNVTGSKDEMSIGGAFDELVPTLLECFAVVFIGYLAGRFRLILGPEIKGLSVFTSEFALPPLIFLNLVTINLGNVNWSFIAGILLGKVAVFFLVATTTVAIHRPINLAFAGLYAIFCTQGNDFGLAYPIVSSLYGHRHPMYAGYLYLIAPISLMILNPIGFLMMEIERVRSGTIQVADNRSSRWLVTKMILSVLWEILKNPNVFMTILGIIGNFVFAGELPVVIYGILRVLSSAFAGTVLFLLGFRVVGAAASLAGSGLLLPGVLLAVRMLATPLILCATVKLLCTEASDQDDLVNYAFLYGTVPTGPVVLLFAAQYGLPTDMLASTMVVCTFLSGPLMFISAKMITLNFTGVLSYAGHLNNTLFYISIIGVLVCTWVAILFLLSGRWKRAPHMVTFCLVISQAVISAGVLMWSAVNNNTISSTVFQVAMITGGQLASRFWTAILAISLVLLQRYTVTNLSKLIPYSLAFGFGVPILILTTLLVTTGLQNQFPRVDQNLPLFLYGKSEAVAASFTLAICLITTTLCLILYHRKFKSNYCAPEKFGITNESVASNFHWLEEGKLNKESAKEIGSNNKHENDEGANEIATNAVNSELKNVKHVVSITDNFDKESQPSDIALSGKASISIILEDLENTNSTSIGPTWMRAETSFHERNPTYFIPGVGGRSKMHSSRKKSRLRIFLSTIKRSTTTTSMRDLLSDVESNGIDSPSSSFPPSETSSTAEITEKSNIDQQNLRHVILLTLLSISMIVGLTVSVWKLTAETLNGLFVAMEFLDGVLNFGQGIFTFVMFGFDTKAVVLPVRKWIRILRKGTQGPVLPLEDQLDDDTAFTCFQFLTYHYENCLQDLPRDKCFQSKTYNSVFWGKELVDWLITVGLARGRKDAELYGRRLLNGRVIKHVNEQMHFKDGMYLYAFVPQAEYEQK